MCERDVIGAHTLGVWSFFFPAKIWCKEAENHREQLRREELQGVRMTEAFLKGTVMLSCFPLLVASALAFHSPITVSGRLSPARERATHPPSLVHLVHFKSIRSARAPARAGIITEGVSDIIYSEESNDGPSMEVDLNGIEDDAESMNIQRFKLQLLSSVAGLDRGAAAGSTQRKVVPPLP